MYRVLLIIIGFVLTVIGLSYMIIYLNLLTMGYTVKEYFVYIFTRYECIFFFIGYIILIMSFYIKRRDKHAIHL